MMLTELKPGDNAKIIAIDAGHHYWHHKHHQHYHFHQHHFRQKLSLRGITEVSIVRVISNIGPVTVEVDRNVVSIGRGMAHKIRVMKV
jgi:ferrous iron transport protein A